MGPATQLDPVWALMALFSVVEVAVVALLVAPMPSNAVRGAIQGGISRFWHSQEYVKKTSWVVLTLNSYYLWDAGRSLAAHNKIYAASCDAQLTTLFLQRNALIAGGSIFLFFVMRRLLDIQGQLFATRALAKEAAAQQAALLASSERPSQGGGAGALEQQRLLQRTLTKLDGALSGAAGHGDQRAKRG
ncbi:hypothetical protein HT031_002128 [Scenedesmus sp. PABB004]|nr:hypothetical protein HT031_002128 [Scenedesmus sp. PABB004]